MRADQILDAMQYLDDDLLEEASYFAASEETATKDPAASLPPLPPEEAERTPVSRSVRFSMCSPVSLPFLCFSGKAESSAAAEPTACNGKTVLRPARKSA